MQSASMSCFLFTEINCTRRKRVAQDLEDGLPLRTVNGGMDIKEQSSSFE